MYSQTTQAARTQGSIWLQIADFLKAIGQVFVSIGEALIRIGQIIFDFLFP